MNYWDWIAFITGVLGVILTIFQKIWCWPLGLVSVVISGVAFYNQRLFGDFIVQVFYMISGFYGWIYWNKNKNEKFVVTNTPRRLIVILLASVFVQSVIYYYVLTYFRSDQILFDSILTSCSFTCTFMMTKKWIENWLFWVIIDASYVILFVIKGMPVYALLYVFFSLTALYGYFLWEKQITKQ